MHATTDRLRPAVFLDRDGVINRKAAEGDYVKSWAEVELLPGAAGAVALLASRGLPVFIVTNQRGVALGRMTSEALADITERLLATLADEGGAIAGVYTCTHDTTDGCECRKPRPGLLLRAAADHRIDLARSWMVGDRESDVKAGLAAGCRTILIGDAEGAATAAHERAPDLLAAAELIIDRARLTPAPSPRGADGGVTGANEGGEQS
jgi:D-glycero-D-manno-heptose 1,7-bisphosphate phosphatase